MTVMTGADSLARMLQSYGTTHLFFVPTVLSNALPLMERRGVRPISTHGEKSAAYMADGYARVSRRPGLCAAQTVGDANLIAGLKDAFMTGAPVIAVTGGSSPHASHRPVYQDAGDESRLKGLTKWSAKVEDVRQLPELLRQAFRVATVGTPGPVHLELKGPLGNVLDEEADLEPIVDTQFSTTPPFRPEPREDIVEAIVKRLVTAERPVMVAGGGVIWSGAESALVGLAEVLNIPVVTSLNGKSAIRDNHPLAVGVVGAYARRCANEVVSAADLVFYVGSRTGSMVTNGWQTPRIGSARILHLDIDPSTLGLVYPDTIGMMSDARVGLERLGAAAVNHRGGGEKDARSRWVNHVQEQVANWRADVAPDLSSPAIPIRPERLIGEVNEALTDDTVVVVDTLQASQWTGAYLELNGGRQRYLRCAGSLGWALPAAIGAKCGAAASPVICITGDGGLYYHLAELETAARHAIPLVVVVNNNGAYAGERSYWRAAFNYDATGDEAPELWQFGSINFAAIAEELGCIGARITDPRHLREAIQEGLHSDRPTLIDVVTDPSIVADRGT